LFFTRPCHPEKEKEVFEDPRDYPLSYAVLSEPIVVARVSLSSPEQTASSLAPRRAFWPANFTLCLSTPPHSRYVLHLLPSPQFPYPLVPRPASVFCLAAAASDWRCLLALLLLQSQSPRTNPELLRSHPATVARPVLTQLQIYSFFVPSFLALQRAAQAPLSGYDYSVSLFHKLTD